MPLRYSSALSSGQRRGVQVRRGLVRGRRVAPAREEIVERQSREEGFFSPARQAALSPQGARRQPQVVVVVGGGSGNRLVDSADGDDDPVCRQRRFLTGEREQRLRVRKRARGAREHALSAQGAREQQQQQQRR